MPNLVKASDPKPIGYAPASRGTAVISTVTYSDTAVTYSSATTQYGGYGGDLGEFPRIAAIISL